MATPSTQHFDLFLAHAGPDKQSALDLRDEILRLDRGARVFVDVDLMPGEPWDIELPRAQRASLATVILVSGRAAAAWYLRDEIASAIALQRAHPDEHCAIPVLLEPNLDLPYGIRILNGIDARGEGGLPGVARRLVEVVARLRGRPLPAPPPVPAGIDPRCERTALHDKLCRLLETQFETMLLHSGLPRQHVRPSSVTLAQRALDVVQLVDQGGPPACKRLLDALGKVAPGLV